MTGRIHPAGRSTWALAIATVCWAGPAPAYEVAICDHCSGSQYSQAAAAAGCPTEADVYVVNRPGRAIKHYTTVCSYDPNQTIEQAFESSGDPSITSRLYEVVDFYNWLGSVSKVDYGDLPDPPSTVNTAVDMGQLPGVQNNVGVSIANWAIAHAPVNMPSGSNDILDGLSQTITVHFPDGSSWQFDLTRSGRDDEGNLVATYRAVPGSGVDAEGRPIPTTQTTFLNRSPMNGTDAGNYIALGERLDIELARKCTTTVFLDGCVDIDNGVSCTAHVKCQ